MGIISRPAKQGGFFTYVEKVAASFTKILASEADDDFETIYEGFNGNIDNDNVIAAAGIEYSKLELTGAITTTDLADEAVTTAKVVPLGYAFGAATPNLLITEGGGETTVATVTLTTQGGPVMLLNSCMTVMFVDATATSSVVWRWYRDATVVGAFTHAISGSPTAFFNALPITGPGIVDPTPSAAAHTYRLSVQISNNTANEVRIGTPPAFQGGLYAKELIA